MNNSLMHASQDQQQMGSTKQNISSSGLSMEQPSSGHAHYMSSNTQHTVGSLRRQSRHLEDMSNANETHISDIQLGSQSTKSQNPDLYPSFDKGGQSET